MILIKTKPLSPSLRQKKRYLVFEVISERKQEFNAVNDAILQSANKFIGDIGMAESGLIIMKDKFDGKKGIIKVNHKYVHNLKASLALINKENMVFRSLGVSGILNKAEEKFIAS